MSSKNFAKTITEFELCYFTTTALYLSGGIDIYKDQVKSIFRCL